MGNLKQALGEAFNSDDVAPQEARTLLPPGTYTVEIEDAELKPTKAGTGQYIAITHSVIDPVDHAGRKLWKNINIVNPNPKAEEIGRAELSGLCRSIQVRELEDTDQLIGKIVRCEVKIKEGDNQYPAQNVVGSYSLAGVPTPTAANRPAMDKPAAPKATGGAPWQKKGAA